MAGICYSPLVFAFSFAFFFQQPLILVAQNSNNLIQTTCKRTDDYDLCISSIQSDPRSSTANLTMLAEITIDRTLSNATDTYKFINKLIKKTKDNDLKICLYDCSVMYDVGINDLKNALMFLNQTAYGQVANLVGSAGGEGVECDKVFTKPPVPKSPSPLRYRNAMLEKLCSISKVIVSLIA